MVVTCMCYAETDFKNGKYKLPKVIKPTGHWPGACPACGCTSSPEVRKHDMEVFSSLRMERTKFVVEKCRDCGWSRHADGKEHGMLVVHYKV